MFELWGVAEWRIMFKTAANGLGSLRKRKRKRKDGTYYEFWEGRVTTSYNSETGEQIQRTVTGDSQQAVIKRMKELMTEDKPKEVPILAKEVPTVAKEVPTSVKARNYKKPDTLTLGEWATLWLDGLVSVKASSVFIYKRDLELHILPYFGKMDLRQIEKADVKKWVKKLSGKGLAPKTVKDLHGVLHKILEEAVEEKKIVSNPAHKCPLPKTEKPELNHFDNEDLAAFLNAIKGHVHEQLYKLALFTGIRENEACGLCWDCVDFRNSRLHIKRQLWRNRETGVYSLVKPKDDEIRTLIMPPTVVQILREQQKKESDKQAAVGERWERKGMVFSNPTGGYLSYRTVYDCFKRITRSLGLEVRFHELRHAYASLALQGGDDIKTVQENLGHATPEFTMKVYAHANQTMKKNSAARMENTIKTLSF